MRLKELIEQASASSPSFLKQPLLVEHVWYLPPAGGMATQLRGYEGIPNRYTMLVITQLSGSPITVQWFEGNNLEYVMSLTSRAVLDSDIRITEEDSDNEWSTEL